MLMIGVHLKTLQTVTRITASRIRSWYLDSSYEFNAVHKNSCAYFKVCSYNGAAIARFAG